MTGSDYWMKGVTFGQMRGRLIQELMDLMDKEFQERKWIRSDRDDYFQWHLSFPMEMLFDELGLGDYLKKKAPPYGFIGGTLKSREEAEALYEVALHMYPMIDNCYYDKDFLESAHLEPMRAAAKKAFEVFMENEKENKEFLEFIEHFKKKDERKW